MPSGLAWATGLGGSLAHMCCTVCSPPFSSFEPMHGYVQLQPSPNRCPRFMSRRRRSTHNTLQVSEVQHGAHQPCHAAPAAGDRGQQLLRSTHRPATATSKRMASRSTPLISEGGWGKAKCGHGTKDTHRGHSPGGTASRAWHALLKAALPANTGHAGPVRVQRQCGKHEISCGPLAARAQCTLVQCCCCRGRRGRAYARPSRARAPLRPALRSTMKRNHTQWATPAPRQETRSAQTHRHTHTTTTHTHTQSCCWYRTHSNSDANICGGAGRGTLPGRSRQPPRSAPPQKSQPLGTHGMHRKTPMCPVASHKQVRHEQRQCRQSAARDTHTRTPLHAARGSLSAAAARACACACMKHGAAAQRQSPARSAAARHLGQRH